MGHGLPVLPFGLVVQLRRRGTPSRPVPLQRPTSRGLHLMNYLVEKILKCPVCYDETPKSHKYLDSMLVVSCTLDTCVMNFPIPYAIWQSIPRFPDHVATELCQHCEMMAPGDKYCTPFDRGNALELVQALEEGNEVGPAAWDLLRKCIRSPRNWKYCDTKDCTIVGAELSTAQHFEEQRNVWRLKAQTAEAQIEKMLRRGVVQFAQEKYLRVSDTILLPPCHRCNQLPDVEGNRVQHYRECDDQGEHGSGPIISYSVPQWWRHVADQTYCQRCECRPGKDYDDFPTDDDPELTWSDDSDTYYHSCGCGESSNGYTTQDWWFENTSLRKLAQMPHGEELLSMRLEYLREKYQDDQLS